MGANVAGLAGALRNFKVDPDNVPALLNLVGLGALAIPVMHHLSEADTSKDRLMSGVEAGGLGLLAAPEIMHLAH